MPDFPRMPTPKDVWEYATRTLTEIKGTPRVDLIGVDASFEESTGARATRIDVPISTRATPAEAASAVWGATTRTLTGITGTPRIDLIGVDASFEASTGARAVKIDRLAAMDAFDAPIEGTLTADGTEQNLILDEVAGNPSRFLDGFVDLSPMVAGDTVVIRQYLSLVTPVDYKKYAEETYSGAQALPLLYITTKTGRYGIRVTLQQTAGVYKTFRYQFFRRRIA